MNITRSKRQLNRYPDNVIPTVCDAVNRNAEVPEWVGKKVGDVSIKILIDTIKNCRESDGKQEREYKPLPCLHCENMAFYSYSLEKYKCLNCKRITDYV